MLKATINDIARELNTTPATVSRALSDHPRISAKTKKSVHEAALKLNYKRNKIASSLRSGKTHLIGVIIPSAEINFFGSVVHGIESVANSNGYGVLLFQSNEKRDYEEKGLQNFLSARVDGILVSIAKDTVDYSHFMEIKSRHVPIVFFDRTNDDLGVDSVVIDDYKGAFMATEHLVSQGYKRIAHISGPGHLKNFHDRLSGYMDALRANKMEIDHSLVCGGNVSIESGREGTRQLLSLANPPDAIFATEDFTALGVIKEVKEKGMKIPKEFGVIGFANEQFGEHITPTLSTVDQQTIGMGRSALSLLLDIIEKKGVDHQVKQKIILEPLLICRDSSNRKGFAK
ncbi:MAG TPA: LacI family DNA-binding transcriptional regulator [Chitinophagaceae bacterium]|jgi:LacI family transcriptional regulator, galactose operon repressor|nr:LacI family DNA-binding transcriptional regulator [Chitinophagaceae bacterium]